MSDTSNNLPSNPIIPGIRGIVVPKGSTAQRREPARIAEFRLNTETKAFEGYNGEDWVSFGTGSSSGGASFLASGSQSDITDSTFDPAGASYASVLSGET